MNTFVKATFLALAVLAAGVAAPTGSLSAPKAHSSFISVAHADEPAAAASPAAPAAAQAIDKVSGAIQKASDSVPTDGVLIKVLAAIFSFGALWDFLRRKWPTLNPASLWRDLRAILGAVQKLFAALASAIDKLDQVGDKVIGQNIADKS